MPTAALLTVTLVLAPQDGTPERLQVGARLQTRIDHSIDSGIEALLAQQELDGSWRAHTQSYAGGPTALVVYTLTKCGLPTTHPAIMRALEFVRQFPSHKTYGLACQIMALSQLGADEHRTWIGEMMEELISHQTSTGFSYAAGGRVDLSNTQYAALGLRTGANLGHAVPHKTWERLAAAALEHQEAAEKKDEAAGFSYHPEDRASGGMTAAGVTILAICEEQMRRGNKQPIVRGRERGVQWLIRHFSVRQNHKPDEHGVGTGGRLHYYLYGLERVAGLLEIERFAAHEWYREGAEFLVDSQDPAGRWSGQAETCFALLFLSRATARHPTTGTGTVPGGERDRKPGLYGQDDPKSDVSLRASGRARIAIWISSFGTDVLEKLGQDGEEGAPGRAPLVHAVEYLARALPGDGATVPIASLEGNPSRPAIGQRFAVQHAFTAPGAYEVFARVTVEDLERGGTRILESSHLRILVGSVEHAELDGYARDGARNLLREVRATATGSTVLNNGWDAARAVDGMQATGWRAAVEDSAPKLTIELSKTVRANTLVLSHAHDFANQNAAGQSRVARVRVTLNGKARPVFEASMNPDVRIKTVIDLGKPLRIRSLEIEVLEGTHPGAGNPGALGFNEVELQLRKR